MLKKLFLLALILIVGFLALGYFSINSIVKDAIESYGPGITKTTVTVDSVNLSPFSGEGSIHNLVIGSPEGFSAPNMFSLGEVSVRVDIASLLSPVIRIQEITLKDPALTYEVSGRGGNINALLANVNKSAAEQAEAGARGAEPSDKPSAKVEIDQFQIEGGQVHLVANVLQNSQSASLALPPITLQNIGKESGGTSFSKALSMIVKAIGNQVSKLNFADLENLAGDAVNDFINSGGNVDQLKDTLGGAGDSLKSLFGGGSQDAAPTPAP